MSNTIVNSDGNRLVRDSRAGDRFHYCWAAKRSLLLLRQDSGLERILIESDVSQGTAGEYSLDMTETYRRGALYDRVKYQFKYSVERVHKPFSFSELRSTIVGFSKNFLDSKNAGLRQCYLIVTNRGVSAELKSCVRSLAAGGEVATRTMKGFVDAIGLSGEKLKSFCAALEFRDAEADLEFQVRDLHVQAASYTAGIPPVDAIYNLVDLVARKALPESDGEITVEDVLSYFCPDVSSVSAFYPAPAKFDARENWIPTSSYQDVRARVLAARRKVFVHAAGGVGKTVTLRMLASDLPQGSESVIFDCFASGEYSNRLQYRHTPTKALVQIANELSARGLCNPLVVNSAMSPQLVLEAFGVRIQSVVAQLRSRDQGARLYVFVDAADNARMMADENKDPCFVDWLLESNFGDGCCFVFSARTGRMNEFWPDLECEKIELKPFTGDEVYRVLQGRFKDVDRNTAQRFLVRTSGLPRAVTGILADCVNIKDLVRESSFAPLKDYDAFLDGKFRATFKRYSRSERGKLEKVCCCLVLLPPNVPIRVLCSAAEVSEDFVHGFMADWERPLWRSQEHVHFRDEPTETWFRSKFGRSEDEVREVVRLIKPLSSEYVYVAQALPSLLLKAEDYAQLARLAESDELLPDNIHISERKMLRLERLRFAVSAMIRLEKYADALRLALIAGDMASESVRRDEIIKDHLVFAARVLPQDTVRELAATRRMQLSWGGSENLCAGVLLASLSGSRDEVNVCLQSAMRWLRIQFEKENRQPATERYRCRYDYSHEAYLFARSELDANGIKACVGHICRWGSGATRFIVASRIAHDCVVLDKKETLEALLGACEDAYALIGFLEGAMSYGLGLTIAGWRRIVRLVSSMPVAKSPDDIAIKSIRLNIAKFAVWLARQKGGRTSSVRLLKRYCLPFMCFRTYDGPYDSNEDSLVYYVFAKVLQKKSCSENSILRIARGLHPGAPQYELDRMRTRLRRLIPAYKQIVEAYLTGDGNKISGVLSAVSPLLGDYELFHQDKSRLFLTAVWLLSRPASLENAALLSFVEGHAGVDVACIGDLFDLTMVLRRRGFVKSAGICQSRGTQALEQCKQDLEETPDRIADLYIRIAKACFATDRDDARGYFAEAIEVLSKCGDELLPRWAAATAIAQRLSRPESRSFVSHKLVYDFTRCGEYVRRCVCRDKYYNRDEVFSILVDFEPAYAWATYSRWRDRDIGFFLDDLNWIVETFTDKGVLSLEEAWTLRGFGDCGVLAKLQDDAVRAAVSNELKHEVMDELLVSFRKNGCANSAVALLKSLAKELHAGLPTWVETYEDPQKRLWRPGTKAGMGAVFAQVPCYDGADPDWVHNVLEKTRKVRWEGDWRESLFSKVPENLACSFLRRMAADERVSRYDAREIICDLPSVWRRKPGVRNEMPKVLARLVTRSVESGSYEDIATYSACAKEFGLERYVVECYLKSMANADHLSGEAYFQLVKQGLPALSLPELIPLFESALQRVSVGMPEGFGDGDWNEDLWPESSFREVSKDVLWTAMGDPDVELRWKATHCFVNELLRTPDEMVGAGFARMERTDFTPCVSRKLPFYFDFARIHFLLALAKVSARIASAVRNHSEMLIHFLQNQEHVLIRYLGWQALVGAGVPAEMLAGINPFEDEKIREVEGCGWNVKIDLHPTVRDATRSGEWFPTHYDFDKYWLSSLLDVFGLREGKNLSLLAWVVKDATDGHWPWAINQDPRNGRFRDDGLTEVSGHAIPEVSDYNFYTAYNVLMVLAGRLLKYQPVIKESGDSEDRFSAWMREILPVFSPDPTRWHSDARSDLPKRILMREDLRKVVEEKPLQELDLAQLLEFSADENQYSIDGFWRIGDYQKELECSFSCALVARQDAERVRDCLVRLKDPFSLALPTLFDHPNADWSNHGKFPWRGLFDSEHSYPRYHLDEKDPGTCGLRLTLFHVARSVRTALGLKECTDHVSLAWPNGEPAFVPHYWGRELYGRHESPDTYGATLNMTRTTLAALCEKYQSELIVEVVLKRYRRGYSGNSYRREDEEKCYRYALLSPEHGVG